MIQCCRINDSVILNKQSSDEDNRGKIILDLGIKAYSEHFCLIALE